MKRQIRYLFLVAVVLPVIMGALLCKEKHPDDDRFVSHVVDTRGQSLQFYWKDDQGKAFRSILSLKNWLEHNHKKLLFAMNAGMYRPDGSPLGLFIEQGIVRTPLNTAGGEGNFYLKPNGVFYVAADGTPGICNTADFTNDGKIQYATQSGPLLLAGGQIHSAFKQESVNLNIRNGVGILPDNKVLFAMSKSGVNFYDFASYFKSKGCRWALYLDGLVSRIYLPEKQWLQTDGDFGVMIGVVEEAD